jgi:hypothetical protein
MISANSMSILKVCTIWRDARWTQGLLNWGVYAAAAFMRLKALAPYAMIELVLPGGSVMALLLWLYRRRKSGVGFGKRPLAASIVITVLLARCYRYLHREYAPDFSAQR